AAVLHRAGERPLEDREAPVAREDVAAGLDELPEVLDHLGGAGDDGELLAESRELRGGLEEIEPQLEHLPLLLGLLDPPAERGLPLLEVLDLLDDGLRVHDAKEAAGVVVVAVEKQDLAGPEVVPRQILGFDAHV